MNERVIINCHFPVSHRQCESDLPKLPSLYSYPFTATPLIQCLHCNIFSNVNSCKIFQKVQSYIGTKILISMAFSSSVNLSSLLFVFHENLSMEDL